MAEPSDSDDSEYGMIDHALLGVGFSGAEDDDGEQPMEDESSGLGGEEPNFDPNLATQHAYLGRGEEVYGRTVLEDGSSVELPLLYTPAVMLVPGQTLPLSIFHPASVAMVRRVVASNRTFGFINHKCVQAPDSSEPTVGTTAEIYEVKDDDASTGFVVKARGRQRFRVISTRTLVDGTKVGTVQILADEVPAGPFGCCRPPSVWRLRLCPPARRVVTAAADGSSLLQVAAPSVCRRRRMARLDAAGAPWPHWLYGQYEVRRVAARARAEVQRCLVCQPDDLPTDPTELSFWVAMSLPIDDETG